MQKKPKRFRHPKPKQQLVQWAKPDRHSKAEITYSYGGEGANAPTARLICEYLERITYKSGDDELTLLQHLEKRGYDLTTLMFSISLKETI